MTGVERSRNQLMHGKMYPNLFIFHLRHLSDLWPSQSQAAEKPWMGVRERGGKGWMKTSSHAHVMIPSRQNSPLLRSEGPPPIILTMITPPSPTQVIHTQQKEPRVQRLSYLWEPGTKSITAVLITH